LGDCCRRSRGHGRRAGGDTAIQQLAAEDKVVWHRREFEPDDLDGMALAVAAVPKDIARAIYREARTRGVLLNSVDDPDNCDFYYPAVVNRGRSADCDFDRGT
jgi:precorrin-2 dehydrogenase/sirohydrochlorin ferrochelatase